MTDTGFFKWLWRFNALAIAAATLGALVLMGFVFVDLISSALRANRATNVLAVPEGEGNPAAPANLEEHLDMGALEVVQGTTLLRGELRVEQSFDYGFSSKDTAFNTLNLFYLDPQRGEQRWLFPSGRRLIVSTTDVERRTGDGGAARVLATLFHVVSQDTSGDGRLSASDRGALMIAAADGTDLRVLAEGLTTPLQSGPLGAAEQFVVIEDATGKQLLRIDGATRSVVGRMTLDVPPPVQ